MPVNLSHRHKMMTVALLSLTLLSLEIIWTRIFSAEFFYNFAFMILSFAIMGLGLGGLFVKMCPRMRPEKRVNLFLLLTAVTALAGPIIAFKLPFEFSKMFSEWPMLMQFFMIILFLELPFFAGGGALAILFRNNHEDMARLYMADLTGAASGIVVSLLLMNTLGTPAAVIAATLPVLLASLLISEKYHKVIPATLITILLVLIPFSEDLLKKDREERMPVVYTHWDAMSKIKIFADEQSPDYRGLNIDNAANSPVYSFDGNWDKPADKLFEFGIDVKYLIQKFDSCTFMSLGAGGGVDVLQALQYGAQEVHAVEVNPHINYLLTRGLLAEFSGRIYSDPKVKVITEDARAYSRRFENKFDVIYSLSSNTFAALSSGAFSLAENYLFTTEAFEDYYHALTANGFLSMEHQFYMPRIVSEALMALKNCGVPHPESHIAIYDLPKMRRKLLLFSKAPLTVETMQNAYGPLTAEKYDDIHLLYPASTLVENEGDEGAKENIYSRIVTEGWQKVQEETPINLSPCSDNNPFTAQLGMWKSFDIEKLKTFTPLLGVSGFPLSNLIVLTILAAALVFLLPLNLIPFFRKDHALKPSGWLYFFFIGAGFMLIEVVLIQKYTLFIGPSFYTIIATLFTLLTASGIGSRFSAKLSTTWPFMLVAAWVILEIVAFKPLTLALGGLGSFPRILLSMVLIFPLGFFMGMPFPIGTRYAKEQIDWGFAVNGMASVIGSAGALLIAFRYGFNITLIVGALCYIAALGCLTFFKKADV